jgi:hypothetical protein
MKGFSESVGWSGEVEVFFRPGVPHPLLFDSVAGDVRHRRLVASGPSDRWKFPQFHLRN